MLTSPSIEEVCLCAVSVGWISTCKPAIKRRVYMYIFTPSEYKLCLENCLTTMIVKNYSPDRYIFIFSHLYAQKSYLHNNNTGHRYSPDVCVSSYQTTDSSFPPFVKSRVA